MLLVFLVVYWVCGDCSVFFCCCGGVDVVVWLYYECYDFFELC